MLFRSVKGYRHAFAYPEDEAVAEAAAKAATAKLKERGAKEWAKIDKKAKKAKK